MWNVPLAPGRGRAGRFVAVRMPQAIENAIDWLRHELPKKVDPRVLIAVAGIVAGVGLLWALTAGPLAGDDAPEVETRVVTVAVETDDAADAPVGSAGIPAGRDP